MPRGKATERQRREGEGGREKEGQKATQTENDNKKAITPEHEHAGQSHRNLGGTLSCRRSQRAESHSQARLHLLQQLVGVFPWPKLLRRSMILR